MKYPTDLDAFVNPSPADTLDTEGVLHSDQHGNANDAIEALEAKVGVTGSVDTNSLDYKANHIPAGIDGTNGTNGTDGATPVKGVDYFDGTNGTNGTNGTTPVKGVDYFDGAKGDTGTAGTNGTNGLTTSVNGITQVAGAIAITPDNLDDAATTHKFVAAGDVSNWNGKENAGVANTEATDHVATHAALKTGVHGVLNNIWVRAQANPDAETGANTLTIADLLLGIVVGTPAGAVAYTLPTGTLCDAGMTIGINEAFDWVLINVATTALNIITLTAGVGHTIVGGGKVPANSTTTGGLWGTCAQTFRTRKTAANTFITYRIG